MAERQTSGRRERGTKYGVALLALALMGWAWHFGTRQAGEMIPARSRKAMPQLVLAQLDGGTWRLEDHRGQVVLVNYWATWCGPCREEVPGLVRLSRDSGASGLAVVGVSLDQGDLAKVKKFVEDLQVPYPVVFPDPMSQIASGMEAVPTTILVDREGRVARIYVGKAREKDLREEVKALLAEGGETSQSAQQPSGNLAAIPTHRD